MIPNIVESIYKEVSRSEFENVQNTLHFHDVNNRDQWRAIVRLEDWASSSDSNFVILERDIRNLIRKYRQLLTKYIQLIEINTQLLEQVQKFDNSQPVDELVKKFNELKLQD